MLEADLPFYFFSLGRLSRSLSRGTDKPWLCGGESSKLADMRNQCGGFRNVWKERRGKKASWTSLRAHERGERSRVALLDVRRERTSQKWLSSSKVENDHIRRAQDKTSPPSWKMVTAISTFQFFQKDYWTRYPQRWLGLVKTHAILQEGERYLSWMRLPHDTQVGLYGVAKCVPEFLFNDAENWIYWTQYKVAESKSWLEENRSQMAEAPERPMLFPNLGY